MPQRNPAVNAAGYEDEASWPFKSRFQQELTEQFDFSIIAGASTMDEDYEGGGFQGGDGEDAQDDMIYQDGNREDLDQPEGAEDRTDLLMEAPAHLIDKSKRITTRYMTKYERARVLGTRALQIR